MDNRIIKLRRKTLKGKNRIREHGEFWLVLEVAPEDRKHTPNIKKGMMKIESIREPLDKDRDLRWISPDDSDFEIVEKE